MSRASRSGEYEDRKKDDDDLLYGIIVDRIKKDDAFVVISKEKKFHLTQISYRHTGVCPQLADMVKFKPKKRSSKGRNEDTVEEVDEYVVVEQMPEMFKSDLREKRGKRGVRISCSLTFDRQTKHGINVFYNEWIGQVFDKKKKLENPLKEGSYQCSVTRIHSVAGYPNGMWLLSFVQFQPFNALKGPFIGFLFKIPSREEAVIWCREVRRLLVVVGETLSAFGKDNVGIWVDFYVDEKEEVGRLERRGCREAETKMEGDKYMSSLLCDFEGEVQDDVSIWKNSLAGEVFDKNHVTQPIKGDRSLLLCVLDCSEEGNEEWMVERVEEMEREQRNEREENVERNEREENVERNERVEEMDGERCERQRDVEREERYEPEENVKRRYRDEVEDDMYRGERYERAEDMEREYRNERVGNMERGQRYEREDYDERDERNNDVEMDQMLYRNNNIAMDTRSIGTYSPPITPISLQAVPYQDSESDDEDDSPSLYTICHNLFRIPEVRQAALKASPVLYAQLLERLSDYGNR